MAGLYSPALLAIWGDLIGLRGWDSRTVFATNALLNRIGLAGGGLVGGVLIANHAFAFGFGIDGLTFIVSAVYWLLTYSGVQAARESTGSGHKASPSHAGFKAIVSRYVESMVSSWRLIRVVPWLCIYVIAQVVMALPSEVLGVAAPTVMVHTMSGAQLGLWAALPSWILLGGNVIARIHPHLKYPGYLLAASDLFLALAYVLVLRGSTIWLAIGAVCLGRLAQAQSSSSLSAYVADNYGKGKRGRVFALSSNGGQILAPLGALLANPCIALFGAPAAVLVCGIAVMVISLTPLTRPGFASFSR